MRSLALLIKGFLFAQTQLETLPDTILFYNGGAKLTCEGSDSIEDLKKLEEAGVSDPDLRYLLKLLRTD
ncbi:MAG: hypothetical protein ACLUD2_14640 [Clostridium sp.]